MKETEVFSTEQRILELIFAFIGAYRSGKEWLTTQDLRNLGNYDISGKSREPLTDSGLSKRITHDLAVLDRIGVPIISDIDPSSHNRNKSARRYKIDAESYPLDLYFTQEESIILAMASDHSDGLVNAPLAASAWAKLASAGADRFGSDLNYDLTRVALRSQSDIAELKNTKDLYNLNAALKDNRRIRFIYQPHSEQLGQERECDVYGIHCSGTKIYVVGWDYMRKGVRVFRLRNIHSISILDRERMHYLKPGQSIAELVEKSLSRDKERVTVRVRGIPKELEHKAQPLGDDEYQFSSVNREEIIRDALFYAPHMIVLEPEDIRAEIIKRLEAHCAALNEGE